MAEIPRWLLSSDTHIVEPPDLFTKNVAKRYRDDAPRTGEVDGIEMWFMDGKPVASVAAAFRPGDRFLPDEERPERLSFNRGVGSLGYTPSEWLSAHESAGVYGSVVFPSHTLPLLSVRDPDLLNEVLRAYNEWIEQFMAFNPKRLKPLGVISVDDPVDAAKKVAELSARGFCGGAIPVVPLGLRYSDAFYDPLWEAAASLHFPLHFHIVSHRSPDDLSHLFAPPAEMINRHDYVIRIALTDLILSGVFQRYPDLRVVSVEYEGAWVPHWFQRMDWHYTSNLRFRMTNALQRFDDGVLPSDVARRNISISFTEDAFLMANRNVIGVENLMWGSDFPHAESVFPQVEATLKSQLEDVPAEDIYRMTVANTAELYGFDLPPN